MQTLYRNRHRGFTLIEMAVVLVIVGLLLGGMLVPLATQMETDRRKETTATLESIREALIGFAVINGRLPCPDTNDDGVAEPACNTGANQRNSAGLPFATLGVCCAPTPGAIPGPMRSTVRTPRRSPYRRRLSQQDHGDIEVRATANCAGTQRRRTAAGAGAVERQDQQPRHPRTGESGRRPLLRRCRLQPMNNGFDDLVVWIPTGVLYNRLVAAGTVTGP